MRAEPALGDWLFGAHPEGQTGGPLYWSASGQRPVRRASGLSGECKLALYTSGVCEFLSLRDRIPQETTRKKVSDTLVCYLQRRKKGQSPEASKARPWSLALREASLKHIGQQNEALE